MNTTPQPITNTTTTTVISLRNPAAVEEARRAGRLVRVDRKTQWGNPFRIGPDGDRAEVIRKHADWIQTQPSLLAQLPTLYGKALACWCHPLPCHADTLARLADEAHAANARDEQARQNRQNRPNCTAPNCKRPADGYCLTHGGADTALCLIHLMEHHLAQLRLNDCHFHMIAAPPRLR